MLMGFVLPDANLMITTSPLIFTIDTGPVHFAANFLFLPTKSVSE